MNTPNTLKVLVVGGGIVGVNTAYSLASAGVHVRVIEAGHIGLGTTATSYAWVNANNKDPETYFRLNAAGLHAHQRLAAHGTAPWIAAEGHIEVACDTSHEKDLLRRANRLAERGYRLEEISSRTAAQLVPSLQVPPQARLIIHFPEERALYPLLYVAELRERLRSLDVEIRENSPVVGLAESSGGGKVTLASGETLFADRIVLSAGRHNSDLARLADVELPLIPFQEPGDLTVGHLLRTQPLPVPLTRLVTTDWLNIRPDGGGRLLLQALDLDATADPGNVPPNDSKLGREFLRRLQAVFPETGGASIDEIFVGQRSMPADGRSLIGSPPTAEWLYVLATHSGVTLAPALAEGAAREIRGGVEPLFEEFRLDRFSGALPPEKPQRPRKPGEQ